MMLKLLLKKQMMELFRSYFYDSKKKKARRKGLTVLFFVLFAFLMVGVLGGMFTALALVLCDPLVSAGMGWFYYLIFGMLALFFGVFGSVFNTFTGLYKAKDNDLLFSMPIPVRTIMASRLLSVYLMGLIYSGIVLLPAILVYWIVGVLSVMSAIGALAMLFIISGLTFVLSCLLGWVVARISIHLKNRGLISVLLALVFLAVYYLVYFRLSDLLSDLITHVAQYGTVVRGNAWFLYFFGTIGEGNPSAVLIFLAITVLASLFVFWVLSRSFLQIATAANTTVKTRYVEKTAKHRSVFAALLVKELRKFKSSPNYMLNCGLSIVLLPAFGIFFLIKGQELLSSLAAAGFPPEFFTILLFSGICLLASMNDMAAPSVSLEAKNLWLLQSLPIRPQTVLNVKVMLQILLTVVPVLFCLICFVPVLPVSPLTLLLGMLMTLTVTIFYALAGTSLGIRFPMLNWTNEMMPVKQSAAAFFALFGGWVYAALIVVLYLLSASFLSLNLFLLCMTFLTALLSLLLFRYLQTKGARRLSSL